MNPDGVAKYLQQLARVPTAPFREQWMGEQLDRLLGAIPGLEWEADRFGNRIARLRRGAPTGVPMTFVAHLDHPGFLFTGDDDCRPNGEGVCTALFEGKVKDDYFPGSSVRLFRSADDPGVPATILNATPENKETDNRRVVLQPDGDATGAVLGMWDLPAYKRLGNEVHGRVCDDLAGCAALLAALEHLAASPRDATFDICVVFSRAEESGFCGVICMLQEPELPALVPAGTTFISVETSGETASVAPGDGAIIRLGDKACTFDGDLADRFTALAAAEDIRARRVLMDRGTCEATAFIKAGAPAGGLCIALRHYHNMNRETGEIACEEIDLRDAAELARLITAASRAPLAPRTWSSTQQDEFALFLQKGLEELAGERPLANGDGRKPAGALLAGRAGEG